MWAKHWHDIVSFKEMYKCLLYYLINPQSFNWKWFFGCCQCLHCSIVPSQFMVIVLQSADLLSNLNVIPLQVIAKCFVVVFAISKLFIFWMMSHWQNFDWAIFEKGDEQRTTSYKHSLSLSFSKFQTKCCYLKDRERWRERENNLSLTTTFQTVSSV